MPQFHVPWNSELDKTFKSLYSAKTYVLLSFRASKASSRNKQKSEAEG